MHSLLGPWSPIRECAFVEMYESPTSLSGNGPVA